MFGTLRLFLAVLVVYTHLALGGGIGGRAVFGFYLLSGYLMTLVLNERYFFKPGPYFINRALRLFPDYWLIATLTLIVIVAIPEAQKFHAAFVLSARPIDFIGNLLVLPFVGYKGGLRLVPPTWSVAVEMVHYFLLWLVVARRKSYALIGLALGVGFHAWSLLAGEPPEARYVSVIAALLPFSLGAVLYFHRRIIDRLSWRGLVIVGLVGAALFAGSVLLLYHPGIGGPMYNAAIYLNLCGVAAGVAALSKCRGPRFDETLGDMAYPVFLLHWICGFLTGHFFHIERGVRLFWTSLPAIFIGAWLVSYATRRTIDPLRSVVRGLVQRVAR